MYPGYVSPFFFRAFFLRRHLLRLKIVPRDADAGEVVDERDAPAPVVEREERFGLFLLANDLAAAGAEEAHAPLPFPERPMIGHAFEFDRDAAEARIGVEDGDG
jgi:hypothetical protein